MSKLVSGRARDQVQRAWPQTLCSYHTSPHRQNPLAPENQEVGLSHKTLFCPQSSISTILKINCHITRKQLTKCYLILLQSRGAPPPEGHPWHALPPYCQSPSHTSSYRSRPRSKVYRLPR